MISESVYLFLGICAIILIILSLYEGIGKYERTFFAFSAAIILWVATMLQASGNVGDVIAVVQSENVTGNLTNYSYDIMQLPMLDNTLGMLTGLFAVAITLWAIVLAVFTIGLDGGENNE